MVTLHGGPVVLHPVRATPCYVRFTLGVIFTFNVSNGGQIRDVNVDFGGARES